MWSSYHCIIIQLNRCLLFFWQIGEYIASNGGVVTAEELAPYLDVQTKDEVCCVPRRHSISIQSCWISALTYFGQAGYWLFFYCSWIVSFFRRMTCTLRNCMQKESKNLKWHTRCFLGKQMQNSGNLVNPGSITDANDWENCSSF